MTVDNKLLTKWVKKSVSLNELNFDSEIFQIFYYNYANNKTKIETLQKQNAEKIKDVEKKRLEQLKFEYAKKHAQNIVTKIADYRKRGIQVYVNIANELKEMDNYEVEVLNKTLSLKGKFIDHKPPLIKWIDEAEQKDLQFLEFILKAKEIEFDINTSDNIGRTPLQAILSNNNIPNTLPVLSLFEAGYNLTESDNLFLSELSENQKISDDNFHIYKICNKLTNRSLVHDAFQFSKLLFIIESARQNKLITFKFTGNKWISFANNAIHSYSEYWEYIELAFKRYGLWEKLIQLDSKSTFQKKVEQFYSKIPRQKYDFDEVFNDLYPELEYLI